ncbi:hypothetical protein Syun_013069 [Stephania yunnanensis]|uniref:Uncharacterized protein n=1 Tax=Stephania yunnanensis TaxID=152371 RepID=A0AAP0K1E8_9MAGN
MIPAVGGPALAFEPQQSDLLIAARAPVLRSGRRFHRAIARFRTLHDLRIIRIKRCRHDNLLFWLSWLGLRWGVERFLESGLRRGLLFLFDAKVSVTLGAEIHGRLCAEEPAPVRAKLGPFRVLAACVVLARIHLLQNLQTQKQKPGFQIQKTRVVLFFSKPSCLIDKKVCEKVVERLFLLGKMEVERVYIYRGYLFYFVNK